VSVFFVAEWSVSATSLNEHEQALRALAVYTRQIHPSIKEVRIYRQRWGPLARHAYAWTEEYETLQALDQDCEPPACTCEEGWAPIYALAEPGTFKGAIWMGALTDTWFSRREEPLPDQLRKG